MKVLIYNILLLKGILNCCKKISFEYCTILYDGKSI